MNQETSNSRPTEKACAHIVLLNRSFWPDVEATGQFFTELCQALTLKYKVTVVAGCPYYSKTKWPNRFSLYNKESLGPIEIIRVRSSTFWKGNLVGRFLNWLSYGALCLFALLRIKADLLIIGTDPPFLGFIAFALGALRSIPYVYNCRDLYPDVAIGLGKLNKNNIFAEVFDYGNRATFHASRMVVCLGESMRDLLRSKGIRNTLLRVIPDWVDSDAIKPVEKKDNFLLEKLSLAHKFIFMYSGNIGLSQGFDALIEAFSTIDSEDAFLVFIGAGAGKTKLKEAVARLKLTNVLFFPYQPLSLLSYSLSMADLHIIPLKKGLAGTIVPSKVYGVMAAARPYLAITDQESEPARFVKEYGCGLWAPPQEAAAIGEKMRWALTHQKELLEMGSIGRAIAVARFDKKIVIAEWFALCDEILL